MEVDSLLTSFEGLDVSHFGERFSRMFRAVQMGDLDGLKAIRTTEPEPFGKHLSMNGGILLIEAVRKSLYDVVEFLLANKCYPTVLFWDDFDMPSSALHIAAYNPDATNFLDRLAAYSPSSVDVVDFRYNTPLHIACASNNLRGVQILLLNGAKVFRKNGEMQSPLDLALARGHVECVRFLLDRYDYMGDLLRSVLEKVDFNVALNNLRSRTLMDAAAKSLFDVLGHENVVKAVQSMHCWDRPRSGEVLTELRDLGIDSSADMLNAVERRLQCIDLLVQKQFKFNMLHLSLKHLSHDYYLKAMASLVEEFGLSVNSVDAFHYTPLYVAIDRSDIEGVRYLLDHGAMVNDVHISGMTPLELALRMPVMNESIVRLIVERGAQINFFRDNGWCPLKRVLNCHDESLAQFFVDSGADVDLKNPDTGLTILFQYFFMARSSHYDTRAMRFLLDHGASLDFESPAATLLHVFASVHTSRDRGSVDFMRFLIKYSSNINSLDHEGNTPLMMAMRVRFHSIHMLKVLLESGADPNIQNSSGQTALEFAITLRKVDAISLLMEHCVEYDPDILFSRGTVLMDSIILNTPYARDELFATHAFLIRQDVTCERRCFVEEFIKATREPDSDYLDGLLICLYELLRHSPTERSCISRMTSGSAVLFSEAEHHVLKTKLLNYVSESLIRGVLEYRIVLNEGVSYNRACDLERFKIKEHLISEGITLSFLLLPERDQLLLLSTKSNLRQALLDLVSYSSRPEMFIVMTYPIFGATLARMIVDILAKYDLLSAAALFLNRHVSRSSLRFKSLPQHIIDNIFGYLSTNDLKNLIFLEKHFSPPFLETLKKRWEMKLLGLLRMNDDS